MSMFRCLSHISRVLRQQYHLSNWKYGTKDDVGISPVSVVVHSPPHEKLVINDRFSSFNDDGSGDGPDKEQHRWYNPNDDFWASMQRDNHGLEALGWGAGVVLGIHLNSLSKLLNDDSEFRYKGCPSLLHRVAFSAPHPTLPQTSRAVLHQEASGSDSTEEPSELDKLVAQFSRLYDKFRASKDNLRAVKYSKCGDYVSAVRLWKRASVAGSAKAQYNLGVCYAQGVGLRKNLQKAMDFYKMAAATDHPKALYNLASLYMSSDDTDHTDAMTLMKRSAELGVPEAQTYLGVYYTDERRDMDRAVKLFTDAAAQNHTDAQYFLGICHERGWGTPQNECKSAAWYMKASRAGHDGAAYNLAVFHEFGIGGLPENRTAAKELYQQAAALGNENARRALHRLESNHICESSTSSGVPGDNDTHKHDTFHTVGSSPSLTSDASNKHAIHKFVDILHAIKTAAVDIGLSIDASNSDKRARFFIGYSSGDNEYVNEECLTDDRTLDYPLMGKPRLLKTASLSCLQDMKLIGYVQNGRQS